MREALAALLQAECDVVGTVGLGLELILEAQARRPDTLILNAAVAQPGRPEVLGQLRRVLPRIPVLVLTASDNPTQAAEVMHAGATAYLPRDADAAELFRTVRQLCDGVFAPPPSAPFDSGELSPRRREVLRLLAEGRSMKEIARTLNITQRTVAFHKYGMMRTLGLRTSAELITFAVRQQFAFA
jgi:DNA-binding NarL/FixJ family response regulator